MKFKSIILLIIILFPFFYCSYNETLISNEDEVEGVSEIEIPANLDYEELCEEASMYLFQEEDPIKAIAYCNKAIKKDSERMWAYIIKIEAYFNINEIERIINLSNRLLEEFGDNKDTSYFQFALGRAYNRLNQPDKALEYFNKAISYEENPEYYYHRSITFDKKENYDEALKDINKAIGLDKERPSFIQQKVRILLKLGRVDEATNIINKEYEKNPEIINYLYEIIWELIYLEKYETALKLTNLLIEKEPENSELYFKRGNIYIQLDEKEKAFQDLDKAIELNPYNPDYYMVKSYLFSKTQNLNGAIETLSKGIENNPDEAELYNIRGLIYWENSEYEKALQDFDKAIELKPDELRYYSEKIFLLLELGEHEEAQKTIELATKNNPDDIKIYQMTAIYLRNNQQYEEALELLEEALEKEPENADLYNAIGVTYLEYGNYDKAIEYIGKAIEIKPLPEYYIALADAYFSKGDIEKAIEYYNKACEITENDWELAKVLINRGRFYEITNELELALEDYNKSIELQPNQPYAYLGKASVYYRQEKYDEAISELEKAKKYASENLKKEIDNYIAEINNERESINQDVLIVIDEAELNVSKENVIIALLPMINKSEESSINYLGHSIPNNIKTIISLKKEIQVISSSNMPDVIKYDKNGFIDKESVEKLKAAGASLIVYGYYNIDENTNIKIEVYFYDIINQKQTKPIIFTTSSFGDLYEKIDQISLYIYDKVTK